MRILITGAHGQLGTELRRALDGHELVPMDLPDFDLTRPSCEQQVLEAHPEVIVHAGAFTDVDGAEREPDLARRVNAEGTRAIAQAAETLGARLIYMSTDYVFDGDKAGPYSEQDAPNPINAYGRSKRLGEEHALSICPSTLVVRTAWLYGAQGKNFVKTIVQLAAERRVLQVVADQYGCPTAARDLAAVLARLIEQPRTGILHVTNEGSCSWYEFAREIVALSGSSARVEPITTAQAGRLARRPANSVLSLDRLHQLGFTMPAWREALRRVLPAVPSATSHEVENIPTTP